MLRYLIEHFYINLVFFLRGIFKAYDILFDTLFVRDQYSMIFVLQGNHHYHVNLGIRKFKRQLWCFNIERKVIKRGSWYFRLVFLHAHNITIIYLELVPFPTPQSSIDANPTMVWYIIFTNITQKLYWVSTRVTLPKLFFLFINARSK